jgi:sarcosine oxidase subunit delta
MKRMQCPLNGLRNISEFVYGGQVTTMPNPATCTDKQWAHYVFYEDNGIGVMREWWLHAPSGYWFIAERHNASDEIVRTYDASECFSSRVDFSASETAS